MIRKTRWRQLLSACRESLLPRMSAALRAWPGGEFPRHEDCAVHGRSRVNCSVMNGSAKPRSSGIEYSEFLAWWKLQDERQKGLKFKSTEEQSHVQSCCQSKACTLLHTSLARVARYQ